jgi:hypothetical protein
MPRYNVTVSKVVYNITDEFDNFLEARDQGIAVRNALFSGDKGYNPQYFFEVEELEDEVDE